MKNTLTILCLFLLFSTGLFAQNWTVIPYNEISDEDLRIISLYEDSDGNVWGGNGYSGRVVRWDGTTWETFNSDLTGLDYDSPSVGEIFQDANGKMWFCSFGDGIATWENGNWFNYNTSNSDIPSNLVSDIIEEDGKLWFSMGKRLVSFDGSTWVNNDIPDVQWNAGGLASMGNGSFFVSMVNGDPVHRFDGTDWEFFSTDNSNIGSNFQYYVEKVDDQTFWFGGPNGRANLYENGTWTPSADMPGWAMGLGDYVLKMEINGSKDDVWFATGGGLFHLKDGSWEEYNPTNSPMSFDEVYTVLLASDGKIWCTTENELLILDPEDPNSTTEETANMSLDILTNPVRETLNLRINNNGMALGQNGTITIFNTIGQPVITQKMTDLQMNVEVGNLAKGTYILEYVNGETQVATRFVKQ